MSRCDRKSTVKQNSVILNYDIGKVSISVPIRFDFYSESFKTSDMGPCGNSVNYSFYDLDNHNWPIEDTTSWYTDVSHLDIVMKHSFSIYHKPSNCKEEYSETEVVQLSEQWHENRVGQMKAERKNLKFVIDEYELINNQYYSIYGFVQDYSGQTRELLEAHTYFNNELISFRGERLGPDTTDFVLNTYDILKSVSFEQ